MGPPIGASVDSMATTISPKGQISIPASLRKRDGIKPGERFEVTRIGPGEYRVKRKSKPKKGLFELLMACPSKGWFVPADRSETTDDIGK